MITSPTMMKILFSAAVWSLLLSSACALLHSCPHGKGYQHRHSHCVIDRELGKRQSSPIGRGKSLDHNSTFDLQAGLIRNRANHVKRAVDFNRYVCKGQAALEMIANGVPATRTWAPEDLKKNGWSTYSDANSVSPDLVLALDGLGVPHAPGDIRPVFANHYDGFTDESGKKVVSLSVFSCLVCCELWLLFSQHNPDAAF